jgi:hypothetical protein
MPLLMIVSVGLVHGVIDGARDGLEKLGARRLRDGRAVLLPLVVDAAEARLGDGARAHLFEHAEGRLAHRAHDREARLERQLLVLLVGLARGGHGAVDVVEHAAAAHVHGGRERGGHGGREVGPAGDALLLQAVDDERGDLFDARIIGTHCARTLPPLSAAAIHHSSRA